jgi:hypothetical protein
VSNTAPAKTADITSRASSAAAISDQIITIRVSPNSYFIALFLATFLSGF